MAHPEELNVQHLEDLTKLTVAQLARLIVADWKNPYFGAKPYIVAMSSMSTVNDNYGADSGQMIVLYFLSNAGTWRGATAKAVKAELKRRCGIK
jgi:hypothetical protein